jgi:hypothetical protein
MVAANARMKLVPLCFPQYQALFSQPWPLAMQSAGS